MSTKRITITQSSTITKVKKPIKKAIFDNVLFSLNRVLDYISKTPGFKRSPAHERAVHIRLAHELTRIGMFDAPAILNPDAASHSILKQPGKQPPNKGMRLLRLGGRGGFAGPDGPDWFVSDDRFYDLFLG